MRCKFIKSRVFGDFQILTNAFIFCSFFVHQTNFDKETLWYWKAIGLLLCEKSKCEELSFWHYLRNKCFFDCFCNLLCGNVIISSLLLTRILENDRTRLLSFKTSKYNCFISGWPFWHVSCHSVASWELATNDAKRTGHSLDQSWSYGNIEEANYW